MPQRINFAIKIADLFIATTRAQIWWYSEIMKPFLIMDK